MPIFDVKHSMTKLVTIDFSFKIEAADDEAALEASYDMDSYDADTSFETETRNGDWCHVETIEHQE